MSVPALTNQPTLNPAYLSYFNTFSNLSHFRPGGMGPTPIPLTEIEAWFRLHQIDDAETRLEYLDILIAMDKAFLQYLQDKQEANTPKDNTHVPAPRETLGAPNGKS